MTTQVLRIPVNFLRNPYCVTVHRSNDSRAYHIARPFSEGKTSNS